MLEGPDAWKDVLILYQSKVSTAVGKQSLILPRKPHTSTKLLPKLVNTRIRRVRFDLEEASKASSGIFIETFQVQPILMILC